MKNNKNPVVLKPAPAPAKAEPEAKAPTKPKAEPKPKAKPESEPTPEPKIPGVSTTARTRCYYAAIIIRRHGGIEAGVTPEMVAELDEMYGKPSPVQAMFDLQRTWHAIHGYLEADTPKEK